MLALISHLSRHVGWGTCVIRPTPPVATLTNPPSQTLPHKRTTDMAPAAKPTSRPPPAAAPPPPPPPPGPPPPPADLYEHLTPWQQLNFSFVIPIVRYGTYKPLQQEDLLPVAEQDRAAKVTARLEEEWAVELRGQRRPSLNRALYRTHRRAFYVTGVLLFMEYALMLAKPVVLRYLLSWLKGTVASEAEVGATRHWRYGFGIALGLAGLDFMQTMIHHRVFFLAIREGWRLRTSVQGLLCKKILRLDSQWQTSASTGQIVSTLANDTQRYEECAPSLHFVWVSPLMALAGFGLLIMYVGLASAAVGCVVTVGVIPFQVWCGRQVGHARRVTAGRTDKRVKLMSEVLSGIQTVKAFVWEAPFRASISAARVSERESLGWAAKMRAITMGIFFVAPTLAAFVTFVTFWGLGNRLELPTVFAVMTLLQTLRECARWIPRSIEQLSEAQVATRRIQPLLELPEVGGRKGGMEEEGLKEKGEGVVDGRGATAAATAATVKSNGNGFVVTSLSSQANGYDLCENGLAAPLLPPLPTLVPPSPKQVPPLPTLVPPAAAINENVVEIQNSDFSWAGEHEQAKEGDGPTPPHTPIEVQLRHLSLAVKPGELLIVAGLVGSGKSTLLDAILGEVACVRGPGVKMQAGTRMAYCSQQPWIQAGTVRENVVFGAAPSQQPMEGKPTAGKTLGTPTTNATSRSSNSSDRSSSSSAPVAEPVLDEAKYMRALEACALDHDLENLANGDQTEIGELGINLSGGQRARVALARAVYADADLYLLDDVLSAVDARVSKHLFHACIRGLLLKEKKAIVLVTHQIQYLPYATRVCLLDAQGGMVAPCAPWEEVRANVPAWKDLVQEGVGAAAVATEDELEKEEEEEEGDGEGKEEGENGKNYSDGDGDGGDDESSNPLAPTPALLQGKGRETTTYVAAEDRVQGQVQGDTYVNYLRNGGLSAGVGILLLLLASQGVLTLADFWLKIWAADQDAHAARDSAYYPRTYAILVAVCVVLGLLRADLFFRFALRASSSLHDQALEAVLAAPLAFFHSNPRGRILNKFAKDLDSADDLLPYTLFDSLQSAGLCLAAVVIGCIAVPYLLLIVAPLLYLFRKYRREFVTTAREVKRLDAITRSPLYADVSSSLQGGKVIRAFRAEAAMEQRFLRRLDENGKCAFLFVILSRYLGFRLDILCAWFLTFLCLMAVALNASLDPGLLGLSLTYALVLSGTFQWAIRQSAQAETFFTSVERLDYYTKLPSEEDEDARIGLLCASEKDDKAFRQLSPKWPDQGEIVVKDLHVRYREDLPIVLNGVDFVIRAGQKVGIVGRTGSGKSSFLAALLRLNQIVGGDIVLDGVSLPRLPRADARRAVSWIPQQPDLFAGTLRFNLDPFLQYNDAELYAALENVHLSLPLDMPVAEGGGNLSVGTRQLLSLARAVLLRRKVLLMDEATASVSFLEDQRIQATLRTAPCFRDCTLVTIAHRINTVIESDLILVFADGRCVEQGPPQVLLATPGSLFADMVQEAQGVAEHRVSATEKGMER